MKGLQTAKERDAEDREKQLNKQIQSSSLVEIWCQKGLFHLQSLLYTIGEIRCFDTEK